MTTKRTNRTLDIGGAPTAPAANGTALSQPGSVRVAFDGAQLVESVNGGAFAPIGGGGGAVLFSPAATLYSFTNNLAGSGTPTMGAASSFTQGVSIMPLRERTMLGLRHWNNLTGPIDFTASLWDSNSGARVATGTATVPAGQGYYEIPFAAPYTLTAADIGNEWRLTLFHTSGTEYPYTASAGGFVPAVPFVAETYIQSDFNLFANGPGEAYPSLVAGAEFYMIEPIFEKVPA